jgi:transketolase
MRREFGKLLVELAETDPLLHLVTGDTGHGIFDEFKARFSDRYMNVRLCEQSMISMSAGMALKGLHPVVYAITTFLIERPWEQVKLDVNEQRAKVMLVGYADYPDFGPTHDGSNMRQLATLLRHTASYFPESSQETRQAVYEAHALAGPAFISLKEDKALRKPAH